MYDKREDVSAQRVSAEPESAIRRAEAQTWSYQEGVCSCDLGSKDGRQHDQQQDRAAEQERRVGEQPTQAQATGMGLHAPDSGHG